MRAPRFQHRDLLSHPDATAIAAASMPVQATARSASPPAACTRSDNSRRRLRCQRSTAICF